MSFRRFRRRGFRGGTRRGRVRPLWDRNNLSVSNLNGATTQAIVLGDPSILPGSAAGYDLRRTIQRVRLELYASVHASVVGTNGSIVVYQGLYMAGAGEPTRSPQCATNADAQVDWLDLWTSCCWVQAGVAQQYVMLPFDHCAMRDVRVKRKLDLDETLVFSYLAVAGSFAGTIGADGTITGQVSILWSGAPT